MTVRKKTKNSIMRSRAATAFLCLCLLGAAGMIGTYVVGRNEQRQERKKQQELAQKEAEEKQAREQAAEAEEEMQEERKQAASANVKAKVAAAAAEQKVKPKVTMPTEESAALNAAAEEAARRDQEAQEEPPAQVFHFSPETDELLWPVKGDVILDYSMDRTVFFATLEQYKYNPAILIQGEEGQEVVCSWAGKVTKIQEPDETGTTVTVDFGDGFEGTYGQLQELAVQEGSVLQKGDRIGTVAKPSRYFSREGTHLYFKVTKDGEPVDPMELME